MTIITVALIVAALFLILSLIAAIDPDNWLELFGIVGVTTAVFIVVGGFLAVGTVPINEDAVPTVLAVWGLICSSVGVLISGTYVWETASDKLRSRTSSH